MTPESMGLNERSVTRRWLLTAGVLGVAGVVLGRQVQGAVGGTLSSFGGLANYLPGGDQFRIYTVTNGYPAISTTSYQLVLSGEFQAPTRLSYAELDTLSHSGITADFQCVTGWRVPKVPWRGVLLRDLVKMAKPSAAVTGFEFYSYDGVYTESLSLSEAMRSDMLIATKMYGARISQAHGGPVRLYAAPMYGYKSIKWLSEIRAVTHTQPGYWEQQGYAVDAWIGRSNGRNDVPVV